MITESEQKMIHEDRVRVLRRKWNAPALHVQKLEIIKPEGKWKSTCDMIAERIGSGFMFGLCGIRGPGKTQMAVALMHQATEKEHSAFYTTVVSFTIAIRETFKGNSARTEKEIIDQLKDVSLLVVDEIGKRGMSDWENSLLFEIINCRYNNMKDTLLINNGEQTDFILSVGLSIASRINECGGLIVCDWSSFRS